MTDAIADRLAVADVIIRYATSVDVCDMERYSTCFTEDIVVTGFGDREYRGLPEYIGYVTKARGRYGRTQHLLGNQEITIDGDSAHMRTYVQATHELPSDPETIVVLWGVYDDDLVRTADGWKISRHHLDRQLGVRRLKVA